MWEDAEADTGEEENVQVTDRRGRFQFIPHNADWI